MKFQVDLLKGKHSVKPSMSMRSKRKGMSMARPGLLLFVMLGGLLLCMAVLMYWVSAKEVDNIRDKYAILLAEGAAGQVSRFLQLQANTLDILSKDSRLASELVETPVTQWRKTALGLASQFPDSMRIRLLAPGAREVDMEAIPPISYSVLEALGLAESSTTAPLAEAHLVGTPKQHVNLIRPVRTAGEDRIVGHILASFGLPVLQELVAGYKTDKGYFELQQPTPQGIPLVLAKWGDPGLKSGTVASRLPTVSGSNWHIAYWGGDQLGRLSAATERKLAIYLMLALVGTMVMLFLVFRWLSSVLRRDQDILIEMLEDLQSHKRKQHASVRFAVCRGTMELIRDIAQTSMVSSVQSAEGKESGEQVIADPLLEDIEPDGGMFGVEEVSIDASVFRKYDIRGIVETSLTPEVVYECGRAIGSEAIQRGEEAVIVGRDGRLSGPGLVDALSQGLRATGCNVIDIGMVPTPVVYYAANTLQCKSGVMVTGSHNPPAYNGLKIVIGGETIAGDGIQDLYRRIMQGDLISGAGEQQSQELVEDYIERIVSDVQVSPGMKVVLDCGNGVAGAVAPQLMRKLGCDVTELFCDVDGEFPNHHPDPGKPENLVDLIQAVQQHKADIGLAFDGDGDRLGVVTAEGDIIWPDRLMMLFASDVLERNSGADIIYDVKCSRNLASVIADAGGKPLMWKTGHSLIKAKMKETGALLAGEMSGHIFFKERWYGFDDALYSAARLLEILSKDARDSSAVFAALPNSVNTPEVNVAMEEGQPARFMEKFLEAAQFEGAEISTIDGLRADYPDGWGLVRSSNTTPVLVLRFEADDKQGLERIQAEFKQAMLAVEPDLSIPF